MPCGDLDGATRKAIARGAADYSQDDAFRLRQRHSVRMAGALEVPAFYRHSRNCGRHLWLWLAQTAAGDARENERCGIPCTSDHKAFSDGLNTWNRSLLGAVSSSLNINPEVRS